MWARPSRIDHAMQGQPRAGRRNTTRPCTVIATGAPVVTCGGCPLVPEASAFPAASAATLIGKRYGNSSDTLKLLCTSRGESELGFDGVPHGAKPPGALPAAGIARQVRLRDAPLGQTKLWRSWTWVHSSCWVHCLD
jgi:hypothetical protein